MTTLFERSRSGRPVTWLTLLGVLLLPVIVGGILVAALYNPVDRLDAISAAIVNDDEPVEINGQLAPLGRQLTAGLVKGADDAASNLDWTISNSEDAAEGLADGRYNAVITIPAGFSAAATSTADGASAEQATIAVQTAPDAKVVDEAITAQIAQTAAAVFGQELSKTYLENVFVGFTTLSEQLGTAAGGAAELASGARSAADGATQLPGGATQLAAGADELSSGAGSLASGLDTLASSTRTTASGAGQLAGGLTQIADTLSGTPLIGAAQTAAIYTGQAASETAALAQTLGGLAQEQCTVDPAGSLCAQLQAAAGSAVTAATSAGTADGYAQNVSGGVAQLTAGTSGGLREAAAQTEALSSGLTQIAGGTSQSASGARQLSSGASQLGSGATELATGAQSLADGVSQLASGTSELASGLQTASDSIPAYTDQEATDLATVVADPVAATGVGTNLFGASAVPLLAVLALWFGGVGSFIALAAVSRRALSSRRPSAVLALTSLAPAAVIGAVQGMLVAGVVQIAASYDWAAWLAFAGLCIVAGVAFAVVNQALVAVFGGAGRWIAALIGVLAVATGVVSTVPGVLTGIASLLPTAPAYNAMLGVLASAGGVGAAIAGLATWSVLAFIATTIAVARRRTTSVRALLAASPA